MGQESARRSLGEALEAARPYLTSEFENHALIFHLLTERFVHRNESFWWPYLRMLPSRDLLGAPNFLEDDVLERTLRGSALLPAVMQRKDKLKFFYEGMVRTVLREVPFFKEHVEAFSFERYEWAYAILDSRSIWWKEDDGPARHLVPMVDLANCAELVPGARPHATAPPGPPGSGVGAVTRAAVTFEAGQEVLETYGHANHVYFLYHGFVLENNPRDCLLWIRGDRQIACLDPKTAADTTLLWKSVAKFNLRLAEGTVDMLEQGRQELQRLLEEQLNTSTAAASVSQAISVSSREAVAQRFAQVEREMLREIIEGLRWRKASSRSTAEPRTEL